MARDVRAVGRAAAWLGAAGISVLLASLVLEGGMMSSLGDKIRSIFSPAKAGPRPPDLPSIYEHIRAHVPEDGTGLLDGGERLPDDEHVRERHGFGWAGGALDSAFVRHGQPDEDESRAKGLYKALRDLADRPSAGARSNVVALFHEGDSRSLLGALLGQLEAHPPRNQERLYEEMRTLALESGHRDVVKFSMMVLSAFGKPDDTELMLTIGRHEEFTYYAALGVSNILEDPRPTWFDMVHHVHGWGRIELTELLLGDGEPEPRVCHFFLREGASNHIMNEYTAHTIATKCGLYGAFSENPADGALLEGAGEILRALASNMDGPGGGSMLDYPEAGEAVAVYLEQLESRPARLGDYLIVDSLRRFPQEVGDEQALLSCGWSPERRAQIVARAARILARDEWRELAQAGLESQDDSTHYDAMAVARKLGLPLRPHIMEKLEEDPLSSLWYDLVHEADAAQMDEVLEMASRLLDVEAIATGPANELGLGPEYKLHSTVAWILQELRRFPGKGWEVIRAGLRSPVVNNRNFSWKALAEWPPEMITGEVREALMACRADPNEDVRQACEEILARAGAITTTWPTQAS